MANTDYGFAVCGAHGAVQIDGETVCANYAGRVQASTSVNNDMGICYRGKLGDLPAGMIFHRSPVPLTVRGRDSYFNSRIIYSSAPVTTDFYAFNDSRSRETNDYGIEVYDSNGGVVFSSAWGPLKIVQVITLSGNSPPVRRQQQWTIPASCVAAMSTPTEYMEQPRAHTASIYGGGIAITGTTLTYSWIHMGTFDTFDDIHNTDIPYYYGYDSNRPVQILVARLDYL